MALDTSSLSSKGIEDLKNEFPDIGSDQGFWSSSVLLSDPSQTFYFSGWNGGIYVDVNDTYYGVRCIRREK